MVIAALVLLALDLMLVFPAVLGGRVLAPENTLLFNSPLAAVRPAGLTHPSNYLLADAVEVFHPDLQWARGVVRGGGLPLWNPLVFGGWPEFASQQTALLYPLTAIAYVLPFWQALGVIAVAKLLLAGLGAWWLCRRLGLGRGPALLAAVAYSLGAYFVIWLEHPQTNVWALIPWLLGAIELVCSRRRARDAALLATFVGLCLLGGHPESSFIAGLAGVPFALVCVSRVEGARVRRRCVWMLTGGALLGVAAGAVMLVPLAQMAAQSSDLARGGGSGLPDNSLLGVVFPDLWGRPDSTFEGVGPINYAERTFYFGVLPLMLAAGALYRPRDRRQAFFIGLPVAALILAVHVPGLTGALDNLPVVRDVNMNRALILVTLGVAVLAAYGLEHWLAAGVRQRRVMLSLAGFVGGLPLLWLATHGQILDQLPRFTDIAPNLWGTSATSDQAAAAAVTRWFVFAACALALLCLLTYARARQRRRATSIAVVLLIALAAADVVGLNRGYHPAISQTEAQPPPTPSILAARAAQGHGRALGFDEYLIPNVGSRYGLRDPRGHGLPSLTRYLALWNGLGGWGSTATRLRPGDPRAAQLLDDFAVDVLEVAPAEAPPPDPALRLVAHFPDGSVYRNLDALPRTYFTTAWRATTGRQRALAETLSSTSRELRHAPVIEGVHPDRSDSPAQEPAGGTATFTEDGDDTVAVQVHADRPGYLVLLDTDFPGWSATVDGHSAAIHPANEAFRAVAVPAGDHRVLFRYRPTTLIAAAILSAVAWITIIGLAVVPRIVGRPMRRKRIAVRPAG
jgi:Bacterial membrane protein YfhO